MIVQSLDSVSGSRLLCPAVVIKYFRSALPTHRKYFRQRFHDVAAFVGGDFRDKLLLCRREIEVGTRDWHRQRVQREIGRVALEEIIDIRSAAQKDPAQDEGLHGFRMRDGVSQSEHAAPTAAENVHLAVDIQLPPQPQHVTDKMLGRIVGKSCCWVVVACTGGTLAAAALVEKDNPVSVGIEKASERFVTARSWPSMHDQDRLTVS